LETYTGTPSDLQRYKYYLWSQYYELYVVGITKQIEQFNKEGIKKIFTESFCGKDTKPRPNNSKRKEDRHSLINNEEGSNIHGLINGPVTALTEEHHKCGVSCFLQTLLHFLLKMLRFCAQLAVVPLLIIQMFDTYAFLCMAADNYCTMRAQYKLHLDQTAVTFGFYCSLMISLLTTTMSRWVPLPKNIRG